ncbi:MAG: glycosyltransferase [Candidatus Methanosuratus sp.]|nr:glycosyltransferase [Candidatus Methanosuratincola sp.]
MDLSILVYSITGFFSLYTLYYFLLFCASYKKKQGVPKVDFKSRTRFLVLVPAHNEEAVIGEICSDLLNQKYPGDLFRVLVIADNCCDSTARIVRKFECERLRVVERRSEIRGKGAALDYVLENKPRLIPGFDPDYVVIFDADNRVPEDFLGSLSVQAKGQAALQCNVKTKNPGSSWLTKASYYEGILLQRLWQQGKDKLGLCTALAGTGEAIRYDLISEMKFGNSLTDDLDLTIRLARKGMRVKYLHYPCTFDEKPDDLKVEVKRRIRWTTGHFQTFFKYGKDLLGRPSRLTFDAFFYLTNIVAPFVVFASWAVSLLQALGLATAVVVPPAYSILLTFIIFPLLAAISWLEGDTHFVKNFPKFYALTAIWFLAAPVGLVKALLGGATWERTPHKFTSGSVRGAPGGPIFAAGQDAR